jgi:hypothetical protein
MPCNISISTNSQELFYLHLEAVGAPTLDLPIRFADEASRLFVEYRERYGLGASGMKPRCGYIFTESHQFLGKISYNGRIWDADGNQHE